MKKYLLLLLGVLGILSCNTSKEHMQSKPLILLSVEPYVSMVQEIAGDAVVAKCVLPAYVDPHNWEPTHRDLVGYDRAQIWFTIGEGFESPLLKKLRTINPKLRAVSLTQSLEKVPACSYHQHGSCSLDTHFWLDPVADIKQARIIYETLARLIPEKASIFEKNYLHLKEKLTKMNGVFQASLKPAHDKILVTSHGAYTYFCKRYNIEQLVIEPDEGKEPRPKDLTHLILDLKHQHANILGVFTQPQHSNKAAKILAEALSLHMYSVDPYKKDYMETMVLLETYLSEANARNNH